MESTSGGRSTLTARAPATAVPNTAGRPRTAAPIPRTARASPRPAPPSSVRVIRARRPPASTGEYTRPGGNGQTLGHNVEDVNQSWIRPSNGRPPQILDDLIEERPVGRDR